MKYKVVILLFCSFLISKPCWSELIQILHTNDIHSHFEHSVHKPGLGGYSQLKELIEEQKEQAALAEIPSLVLDAGDFLEGNLYYMADHGRKTLEIHSAMGYDAVVIGNHDYLMGPTDLDSMLGDTKVSFDLLCANLTSNDNFPNMKKKIQPYTEKLINGVKVGIIGVTTSDVLYKWRIAPLKIENEFKSIKKWAKILRNRGNEVIIALTHIGLLKDRILATITDDIDLIVGGHSHDELHQVVWWPSNKGKWIPIVQAGKHAEWLGKLLLDYDKKSKRLNVVNYQLLPVYSPAPLNNIDQIIQEANDDLDALYGENWLLEVVGESKLRPSFEGGSKHSDIWMYFINDSMLDAVKSDFAIHYKALSGGNYPVNGNVTRRDLYNSNPRHFEFENKEGHNVYTTSIRGIWIKYFVKALLKLDLPLYFTGITFESKVTENSKIKVRDIYVNKEKLKLFKSYKVVFPESIVRGAYGISPWLRLLLRSPKDTKTSMWSALEVRMRKIGVIDEDYLSKDTIKMSRMKVNP